MLTCAARPPALCCPRLPHCTSLFIYGFQCLLFFHSCLCVSTGNRLPAFHSGGDRSSQRGYTRLCALKSRIIDLVLAQSFRQIYRHVCVYSLFVRGCCRAWAHARVLPRPLKPQLPHPWKTTGAGRTCSHVAFTMFSPHTHTHTHTHHSLSSFPHT